MGVELQTLSGNITTLGDADFRDLASALRGRLIAREDAGYDEVRAIWNAMIDRRPGLIVRCEGTEDVVHAMRFARQHDLLVSVRGGGHNIAGKAVADGAFMIDLQPMKGVQVDPDARTVRVGPGASLGDLDQATQAHGLAVPVGINSTTGVAGLTLGGGFGWLSRKHGLTIDSLRSVDLVTADGQTARASAEEAPDLFWAIRGGGGNFGIVTSFEFAAHPVGPEVLCGLVVHPGDSAASLLREYRELCKSAPDELSVWMVLRKAPPLPFLPEEWHGKDVVVLPMLYAGDAEAGEKAAQPFRAMGSPIADVVGRQPFIAFETMFDPLLTPGARNYWKTHNLPELSDGAIDAIVEQAGRLPSPQCEVFLAQLGGAISRVPADATAYPGRDAAFVMNAHARWESPEEDEHCRTWARELFAAVKPFAGPGAYVNFMPEDETGRVGDAYGTHFQRLREVKKRYDPQNVFRLNQNIPPA